MTKRFSVRATAVAFAVSGLLALAACGGDDSDSSDTDAPDTTEQTDETTEPAGTDTTTGGSDTTTGGSDTTAAGGDAPAGDCAELAQQFTDALGGAANPSASPDELADAFDDLESNVPDDLKDDVSLVGELLHSYAEVYEKVKDDPAKAATDPEVQEALQNFSGPEYLAATGAISAYFSEGCKAS
jgi:hypothetical protein